MRLISVVPDRRKRPFPRVLLNNYSKTLYQLGRLEEAADYAGRAYAKARRTSDQMVIYQSLYGRALIYIEQRDFNHAASTLAEMEPILRRSLPSGNYWLGALASAQALLAAGRGDFQVALPLADQAVAIVEAASKAGRAGSDFLPVALMRRSTVELAAGQPERAGEDAQRALPQLQAAVPPGTFSSMIGRTYLNLGLALQSQGKRHEAEVAFRLAAEHLQNSLGPNHPDTRSALQLAELNKPHQ